MLWQIRDNTHILFVSHGTSYSLERQWDVLYFYLSSTKLGCLRSHIVEAGPCIIFNVDRIATTFMISIARVLS